MIRFGVCLLAGALAAGAQDTMHDAPVSLENGSVKVRFRTDTLIDRTAWTAMPPNELMAHTHAFTHTVRIYTPGRPMATLPFGVNDVMTVRLQNGQNLVVAQRTVPGIGGHVAGHAAIAGTKRPGDVSRELVTKGHNESADLVWVVTGPAGVTWTSTDSDAAIHTKILATGTSSNHRHNAQPVTYQMSGNTRMVSLQVGRSKKSHELGEKSQVVICENRRSSRGVAPMCVETLDRGGKTGQSQ